MLSLVLTVFDHHCTDKIQVNIYFFFYPVVGTDAAKVGSWTAAEVECRHREAASLQTHHVGTAGSAILHIAQIGAILQQSMATSE